MSPHRIIVFAPARVKNVDTVDCYLTLKTTENGRPKACSRVTVLFPVNFSNSKTEYRSCVKCLKDTHGDACIPEVTKYRWRQNNGEIVSSNQPGTCERDTFECDLRLAVKLAQKDYTLNDN